LEDAMLAVMVENPLALPRVPRPHLAQTTDRPVTRVVQSHVSRDEITQASTDYHAGRLGIIPADHMAPRK
jgi:hypothetical protein